MFVKAIKTAKNAIFPIFRFEEVAPGQARVFVVGSGFFINLTGYFISVAHVFDNPNSQTTFRYWGQLPDKVNNPPLTIKEINRNDDLDILVGKIDIKSPDCFYISKQRSDIGKSVCLSGYPLAQIQNNPQGGLELGGVRRYFQPSFILDYAVVNCDNGFGRIRKHDGYLVRDLGLYGMSGGSVFDIRGTIIGMQGSVTSPRTSVGGSGGSISVQNAVIIRSSLISEFLKKNRIRYNFLGRF